METLTINIDIDNGMKAKKMLAQLSQLLKACEEDEVTIDFAKVRFIAGNQFSILGALFDDFCGIEGRHIYLANVSEKLKTIMRKNGIGRMLGYELLKDRFHTVIPYRQFVINEINEFEKYLVMNIFQREDIPSMADSAKNTIVDNMLEVFNNVKEHAAATNVYACGQFFPKSAMLYFTIVDIGKTIKENVNEYLEHLGVRLIESNAIEWAMKEGNSTRIKGTPGGLGFSVLFRFIELNKGRLTIMSDDECYEFNGKEKRSVNLETKFRGTIVTVGINMNDTFSYLTIDDQIEQIVF